jgi:DNA-binding transcriptional ArsR family regulator
MSENETNSKLPKDLITIYSTEDEKIKEIGKLLVSDTGRQILELLFSETLTAKQISQKTGFDITLVKHHIKRMLDLNIIKITKITKSVKSQDMKYYTASPHAIVIVPSIVAERAKNSKLLTRSLKTIYKLTSVVIAGISTWFGTQFIQHNLLNNSKSSTLDDLEKPIHDSGLSTQPSETVPSEINPFDAFWFNAEFDTVLSLIAVSVVIIACGLFFVWHIRK